MTQISSRNMGCNVLSMLVAIYPVSTTFVATTLSTRYVVLSKVLLETIEQCHQRY